MTGPRGRPSFRRAASDMGWTSVILLGLATALSVWQSIRTGDARAMAAVGAAGLVLLAWFVLYGAWFALRSVATPHPSPRDADD